MSVYTHNSIVLTTDKKLSITNVTIINFDYSIEGERAAGNFKAQLKQDFSDGVRFLGEVSFILAIMAGKAIGGFPGLAIVLGGGSMALGGASVIGGRLDPYIPQVEAGDTLIISDVTTQQGDSNGLVGSPSRRIEIRIYDKDYNLKTEPIVVEL
jgi:hypothetical protein